MSKRQWASTSVAQRCICMRHAEFIPVLEYFKEYMNANNETSNNTDFIKMERKRSAADIFLFGEEDLYSLKDIYNDYIEALRTYIAQEELN